MFWRAAFWPSTNGAGSGFIVGFLAGVDFAGFVVFRPAAIDRIRALSRHASFGSIGRAPLDPTQARGVALVPVRIRRARRFSTIMAGAPSVVASIVVAGTAHRYQFGAMPS